MCCLWGKLRFQQFTLKERVTYSSSLSKTLMDVGQLFIYLFIHFKCIQNRCRSTKDIFFLFILLPYQNLATQLPTMRLNHSKFGQKSKCVVRVAASLEQKWGAATNTDSSDITWGKTVRHTASSAAVIHFIQLFSHSATQHQQMDTKA